ncbi:MAG: hypothetical protein Q8O92_10000 [Candidatus Latescibacter sp.]|nr:hypothetical protein [Candidatus Latescibacter sp.]
MQRVKVLAFLVLAAFLAFSCSKDDNSTPTGGNTTGNSSAGSLATHTGNNTVVTESNVNTVTQLITTKASDVFSRALTKVSYGAAKPAVDITLAGDVTGTKSGKAVVNGKYTMSSDQKLLTYNFTCTFYDFSDDNALFLGGAIVYSGSYNLTTNVYDLTYKGGLKFNGTYSGTQDFTTSYKYDMSKSSMTIVSTNTCTSGGKTFSFTYNYPQ